MQSRTIYFAAPSLRQGRTVFRSSPWRQSRLARFLSKVFYLNLQVPTLLAHAKRLGSILLKTQSQGPQRPRPVSDLAPGRSSESSLSLSTIIEKELSTKANAVLHSSTVPDPAAVEDVLRACEQLANHFAVVSPSNGQIPRLENSPASNLLSLEETQHESKTPRRKDVPLTVSAKNAAAQLISTTAYQVVTDPKVFVTPKVLAAYVNVQSLLNRPRSLPKIFKLYASKPVPKPGSNPITYSTPSPRKPSAHIPLPVASNALSAAIKIRDLPLCFDIIESSVCAPAFRLSKFLRKAFIPISGAVLAPFAIHQLASQLSAYQTTMDSRMATNLFFGGILAYVDGSGDMGDGDAAVGAVDEGR
ncbi:MAG: hypothetical protein Q9183_001459 [Haloplaca sp. 2 TL-2023]